MAVEAVYIAYPPDVPGLCSRGMDRGMDRGIDRGMDRGMIGGVDGGMIGGWIAWRTSAPGGPTSVQHHRPYQRMARHGCVRSARSARHAFLIQVIPPCGNYPCDNPWYHEIPLLTPSLGKEKSSVPLATMCLKSILAR